MIIIFNTFMDVMEEYNKETVSLTKFYIENETQLQDIKTVAQNQKWSLRLTRKVFDDPDLETVEISNKLQVHPSVLSKYLQKGLYPNCNRYWAKTA